MSDKTKAERGANQTIRDLKKIPPKFLIGKTILDIGCNEGLVAAYLMEAGAGKVVGFEPHPEAFKKAKAQAKAHKFSVKRVAVVGKDKKLHLRTNKKDAENDYYCNSMITENTKDERYHYTKVKVSLFRDLLKEYKPVGMKIDVEGSEYDMLLRSKLNPNLKWICMEIHWLQRIGAYLLPFVFDELIKKGFGVDKLPTRLKLLPNGGTNSFWGFEVINLVKGTPMRKEDLEVLEDLRRAGRNYYDAGRKTRDNFKNELMEICYG